MLSQNDFKLFTSESITMRKCKHSGKTILVFSENIELIHLVYLSFLDPLYYTLGKYCILQSTKLLAN